MEVATQNMPIANPNHVDFDTFDNIKAPYYRP